MTMATKMTTMLRIFVEQTEIETKLNTKETNKKVRGYICSDEIIRWATKFNIWVDLW